MYTTEPLRNGARLPDHPNHTTALTVTRYGRVFDDSDGRELTAGLHRNEVAGLMSGERSLSHLYRYVIQSGYIYHTRPLVTIEVDCG